MGEFEYVLCYAQQKIGVRKKIRASRISRSLARLASGYFQLVSIPG